MDAAEQDKPRLIGRYVLFREVAHGGMATVHIGRLRGPAGFARTVAIKRLHPPFARDPEFVSMFLDEARLAGRIQHPNVVSVLDVVAAEGELFLVMDYVQGESLSHLLKLAHKTAIQVPRRIYVTIMCGVLTGLDAAHEARDESGQPLCIVHRDVSPQNVLLGLDGVPRVLDFGVAKASMRVHWSSKDAQLKGKLGYMPPEQITTGLVDRRADIYSAGVMLWEGLTGQRLFDTKAADMQVILSRVLVNAIDPPSKIVPTIPKALDAIVLKALAGSRDQRYATAREMLTELERVVPPATSRQVGEWVAQVAGEALRARGAELTGIETVPLPASGPRSDYPAMRPRSERDAAHDDEESDSRPLPAVRWQDKETVAPPRPKSTSEQDLSEIVPRAPPLPRSPAAVDESLPDSDLRSEPPPPDLASKPVLPPPPPAVATASPSPAPIEVPLVSSRRSVLLVAAALAVLLAALGLVRLTAGSASRDLATTGSASAAGASSAAAATTAPVVAQSAQSLQASGEASPQPPPRAPDSAQPGAIPSSVPDVRGATRPTRPTPKTGCNPPFTIDAQGVRIPKRECFR